MFSLPELPYAYDALAPILSERTLRYHHDKHHRAYVVAMNKILASEGAAPHAVETVVLDAAKSGNLQLFNNAAQVWNHTFFWASMSPVRQQPRDALAAAISLQFGGLAALGAAFVAAGSGQFGSGWAWLTSDAAGRLRVRATHDADDTLAHPDLTPLLVCDVWEHAYYLDHQNDRKGFLEAWFAALPNWDFAALQFAAAQGRGAAWLHPGVGFLPVRETSRAG